MECRGEKFFCSFSFPFVSLPLSHVSVCSACEHYDTQAGAADDIPGAGSIFTLGAGVGGTVLSLEFKRKRLGSLTSIDCHVGALKVEGGSDETTGGIRLWEGKVCLRRYTWEGEKGDHM